MRTSVVRRRNSGRERILSGVIHLVIVVSIPIVLLFIVVAVLFTDFFAIQTIYVDVNDTLDVSDIKAELYHQLDRPRFGFIKQNNILFFDSEEAFTSLTSRFRFETLVITKEFPSALRVKGEGGHYRLLWYSDGVFSLIGEQGTIIGPADRTIIEHLPLETLQHSLLVVLPGVLTSESVQTSNRLDIPPLIVEKKSPSVSPAESSTSKSSVIAYEDVIPLIDLQSQLQQSGIDMAFIEYTKGDHTISVHMMEGWELLLILDSTIERQIHQTVRILNEQVQNDRLRLKHIDARFDNRFYYTFK